MEKTYGDIIGEFYDSTNIDQKLIADIRPCQQPYFQINIPLAIIVWLRTGGKLIYISEE